MEIKPHNTRFAAIILGAIGGAVDVYSHMQFDSFVATQTGNIILIIARLTHGSFEYVMPKLLSILFFTVGYVIGIFWKDRVKKENWRIYSLSPLLLTTLTIPIIDSNNISLILLAISTGIMMLGYSDSKIEEHPYTIFMTSGNYRKMISSWYLFMTNENERQVVKRQAVNYSIVVTSFILGGVCSALFDVLFHKKSIWVMTLLLIALLLYYKKTMKK